jgi:hypothetical protein
MRQGGVCCRSGRHKAKRESQGAGGGITGGSEAERPENVRAHIRSRKHQAHKHHTHPHAASGWRIHCGVEVTELSTNKQHSLRQGRHCHSHACTQLSSILLPLRSSVASDALLPTPSARCAAPAASSRDMYNNDVGRRFMK